VKKYFEEIKNLSRSFKILLIISADIFFIVISSYFVESLLLGYPVPYSRSLMLYVLIASFFLVVIFKLRKNYNNINRFFDLQSSAGIFVSVTSLVIILYFIGYVTKLRFFSLNFIIYQNLLFLFFSILFRFYIKYEYYNHNFYLKKNSNCLIFGAGRDGLLLAKNLLLKNNSIIGFVDEDKNKIGQYINNIKVFSIFDIKKIKSKHKINKCFFCAPSASGLKKKQILEIFHKANLSFVPGIENNFQLDINNTKNFNLKKDKFAKNNKKIDSIFNKVVFITGAGGSIGQELFFQIYNQKPKKIIAIDSSEYNLFKLKRLLFKYDQNKFKIKLLNVCDLDQLENLYKKENPDIVFHGAAYKYVDIVEENPIFAAKNNILGTWNVLQASLKFNVKNFVFISTDKAVNPINIMGMTKKCGEVLTEYFSSLVHKNQNFCSVRFGNVIGSSGSFVQVLKEQVASGGPITITDKRASRYFMTISDAVHLVIQAISLRDNGNTFVLKMDEPVNIYEMVKKFLSENNLKILDKNNPSGDIQIKFIGLRQGEKLHEELFQNNNISQTSNNLILVEKNRYKLTDKNLIKFKKDLLESIRLEDTLMLERTLHILLDNANSK
jgi:FlaA1/EpsC-like NDP-sugar epimerase